jgi:hypothetical protein
LVKGWKPDFIITVGDNNYPRGSASTIDQNIGQYYHGFIPAYHGGAKLYPFKATVAGSRVRTNGDYGALLVTASAEKITFQYYTRTGALKDSYSLRAVASRDRRPHHLHSALPFRPADTLRVEGRGQPSSVRRSSMWRADFR